MKEKYDGQCLSAFSFSIRLLKQTKSCFEFQLKQWIFATKAKCFSYNNYCNIEIIFIDYMYHLINITFQTKLIRF